MKVVIQKCKNAKCIIDNKEYSSISNGLMVLVGFCENDDLKVIEYMAKKIVNLRIFEDSNNIMNKSILDFNDYEILSISQFTLYADTKKGNRPSYIKALNGSEAIKLYELFNKELNKYVKVKEGIFKSDMDISFTNIGPTTIIIERDNND